MHALHIYTLTVKQLEKLGHKLSKLDAVALKTICEINEEYPFRIPIQLHMVILVGQHFRYYQNCNHYLLLLSNEC